jgi:hypothetical protein
MAGKNVGILVEGELDATLLHQHAGDLIGIGTVGSAYNRLLARCIKYLYHLKRVYLCYDNDEAGRIGAKRMVESWQLPWEMINVPVGKGIGEFVKGGGDLREWVEGVIDQKRDCTLANSSGSALS